MQKAEGIAREPADAYDAAANDLRAFREEISPRITSDLAWIALNAQVEAVSKIASEADKKAAQAEADRERERTPYESDPLFMYLWLLGGDERMPVH